MPTYAHTGPDGTVVNMIVADDLDTATALTPPGCTAVEATGPAGIGWTHDAKADEFTAPPRRELTADRTTLVANGTDTVTVTWLDETSPDGTVTFAVSGQALPADQVGGVATLTVTADTPGTITVAVLDTDATLTLTAY